MLPPGFINTRRRIASVSLVAAGATVTLLQFSSVLAVPLLPVAVCVYTFAELAFAYVFTAKRTYLEQLAVEQQTSVEQAWVTFNRVIETLRTLSFGGASSSSGSGEAWLLEWFIAEEEGATEADNALCHDNVTELMAEAFFCRPW